MPEIVSVLPDSYIDPVNMGPLPVEKGSGKPMLIALCSVIVRSKTLKHQKLFCKIPFR